MEEWKLSWGLFHGVCWRGTVQETQNIAHVRIHVERAIHRIKEYHLFDKVMPLNMAGTINQLWTVACLLTNFKGPL